MNTRRYPRTLQEAFGPYAHGSDLQPMRDERRLTPAQAVLCVVYALTVLAFILALLLR